MKKYLNWKFILILLALVILGKILGGYFGSGIAERENKQIENTQ